MNTPSLPDQAGEPVAWTADHLYDAIEEVLLHHRVSNMEGDDGEAYPLIDQLTTPGADSVESGQFEVRIICDAIYNEVLTVAAPTAPTTGSAPVAFDSHEVDHGTHIEIVPHYADDTEIDARRYRWLRNPDVDVALVLDKVTGEVPATEGLIGGGYKTYEYRSGVELDTAIDKAMGTYADPASPAARVLTDASRAIDNLKFIAKTLDASGDFNTSSRIMNAVNALLAASMGGDRT